MARSTSPAGASPTPKKQRFTTLRQIAAVYRMTAKADPLTPWLMLLVFAATVLVALGLGLWWNHPIYVTLLGIPIALLLTMVVLSRKAERAAYAQIEGQPGAASAAMGSLRRGWNVTQEPVAVDARSRDLVFRAVGRRGVVLVTEGPLPRVKRLAESERKKVTRVLPNVPVHVLHAGNGDGQVPLRRLPKTMNKLKGDKLSRHETSEVAKRLQALGGTRPPVPAGVDPLRARPDRKSARGR